MASSLAASQICVILGAGPGTGQALARVFAQAGHPVALLARSLDKLQAQAREINAAVKDDARAKAFVADATDEKSIHKAFEQIVKEPEWKGKHVHTGIVNATVGFKMADFMDTTVDDLHTAFIGQVAGGFAFSQAFLKAVALRADWQSPPSAGLASANLFFSGATAALKGGPKFSAFAPAKAGLRMLAQSIAREYQPKNVHVAHVIIDGIIETERVRGFLGDAKHEDQRMSPDAIAQAFYSLAQQHRSAWTHELDLRPYAETF